MSLCVCLLATTVSPTKTAEPEPIEMLRNDDSGEPKEPCIRWESWSLREGALLIFWGVSVPHCNSEMYQNGFTHVFAQHTDDDDVPTESCPQQYVCSSLGNKHLYLWEISDLKQWIFWFMLQAIQCYLPGIYRVRLHLALTFHLDAQFLFVLSCNR